MRNIWTIAKREYNHYFISPIAYVVAFITLLILGIYFVYIIGIVSRQALFGGSQAPDITPINWLFVFLMIFTAPAITMRSLSDEARSGTLELLLTAPIRDFELVAGKWLGGLLFFLSILAVTLVFPLILNGLVSPGIDQKLVMSSYLGVILVAASLLALGVGISAIFSNQIAAFIATLGLFFLIWFMMSLFSNLIQGSGSAVFQYLNLSAHFTDALNTGNIKLSDLVYFFSLIALGLFTGTTALEIRRWR
ncbi:MAG TPA: ABC transporter permease subunit [Anaerolineales bacterium]|nr:ABC transporter permease subunit [Anaerolineales bacterium]HLO28979.1 ABC transporter permease subunit [Anaerolineales bacterium]